MDDEPETPAGESAAAPAPDAPAPAVVTEAETETPTAAVKRSTTKTAIEWTILIASALIIALVVKAFLFQAFYIPSDSMVPTLKTHDRVIVNKLSYKLHAVHRGDIVVFKTPKGPDGKPIDPTIKDLVKRVIGLPGDIVSETGGKVFINGKALNESYLPKDTVTDCVAFEPQCFPTGKLANNTYWVMGDNRAGSRDSRYFHAITKREIVGRVFVRIWPLNRLGLL